MKKTKLPLIVAMFGLMIATPAFGQNHESIIKDYIKSNTSLSRNIVNKDFSIANESYSNSMKGTVVQLQQTYNGLPVYGNYSTVLVRDNQVLNFVGNFTESVAKDHRVTSNETAANIIVKAASKIGLSNASAYAEDIAKSASNLSQLVYFDNGNELLLSYQIEFQEKNSSNYWFIIADATTGQVYLQQNLTLSCNFLDQPFQHFATEEDANHSHNHHLANYKEDKIITPFKANDASYRVFEFPVEAPTFGDRTLINNPWDLTASPSGWQNNGTTEYNITRGNNVYAYTDEMSTNTAGVSADGGASHVFDFPLDTSGGLDSYKLASITNLFYANNRVHDILYKFGFTETSKNFQANNFGKGGAAGDYVNAEARDGAGVADLSLNYYNNANFSTPSDGAQPRMQMYIWLGPTPYFVYNAPAPIAGTSIPQIGLGYFGPPLWKQSVTQDVVISPVVDACTALTAGSLTGKIGIAKRGNCNFILKVKNMEDAGAIAAIIYNIPDAETSPGETITNMSGDGTTPITIPSVFLAQSQGENIVNRINNGENVNVTLKLPVFDGSIDNGVVIHEYGHGLSNRTTGTNVSCLNTNLDKEQMGEGWSDFLAMMMTMRASDNINTARGMGTYASGESTTGNGIRPAKYSTDFSVNNYTYGKTNGMEYTNSSGAIVTDVHSIGFVWATILWDLHWAYAQKYGYNNILTADPNSGTARAFQTVLDGIKLQGCYPTFIMGRDGIINADAAATGGDNKCLIWNVFAKRGVGVGASAGSKTNINDQVEDFTVPSECIMAVTDTNATKAISLYPNPAKDQFQLAIKGNVLGKLTVDIFDASGKLISTSKIDAKNNESIPTTGLQNGVYIVKVSGLGVEYSSKLMIKK